MSALGAVAAVVARDLRLAFRRPGESLLAVAFFALALALFPLGVGPTPALLARIGAGVIWVLALFTLLLSLERLYQADFEDGTLELMLLAPAPLELLVAAKCLAHWLSSGLLLVLMSPVLALLMGLPQEALWVLPAALALGTPTLTLIGSIGAALLLGSRRGATLAALLVLPLFIPVLIFGVGAVDGYLFGLGGRGQLLMLGALFLFALAVAPFATAAALRLCGE